MKKIATVVTAVLLIVLFGISALAETSDFIEDCRTNHTQVIVDYDDYNKYSGDHYGEYLYNQYSPVTTTGFETLWDDRTLITEEDILQAETHNNENEEKMHYALKLKIVNLKLFWSSPAFDPEQAQNEGMNEVQVSIGDKFSHDISIAALCTEQNFNAYLGIVSPDWYCYAVSIEKYDVQAEEHLIAAACDSQRYYDVTFPIPSKYRDSADLTMAKIDKGQVSYMYDYDTDRNTYTIRTNGSALYVFVGEANESDYEYPDDTGHGIPNESIGTVDSDNKKTSDDGNIQNVNAADVNGTVTAPKTADETDINMWMALAVVAAGVCVMLNRKKKYVKIM